MRWLLIMQICMIAACARGNGISFELGKKDNQALLGPPFACRIEVPHSDVGSLRQERAQLDRANALLQFCMAQWETAVAIGGN